MFKLTDEEVIQMFFDNFTEEQVVEIMRKEGYVIAENLEDFADDYLDCEEVDDIIRRVADGDLADHDSLIEAFRDNNELIMKFVDKYIEEIFDEIAFIYKSKN